MENILEELNLSFLNRFINSKNIILAVSVMLILFILKQALNCRIEMIRNNEEAKWSFPIRIISFVILAIAELVLSVVPVMMYGVGDFLISCGKHLYINAGFVMVIFCAFLFVVGYVCIILSVITAAIMFTMFLGAFWVYFVRVELKGEDETDEGEKEEIEGAEKDVQTIDRGEKINKKD